MINPKSQARIDKCQKGRDHKSLANLHHAHTGPVRIKTGQHDGAGLVLSESAEPLRHCLKIAATQTGIVTKGAERSFKHGQIKLHKQRP